ncbi:MAG TPA: hypothetical protein VM737_03065 [Gemmatimonadota bacterium]|nr:hypothetical protein [Gemmatimonadota bacterium]
MIARASSAVVIHALLAGLLVACGGDPGEMVERDAGERDAVVPDAGESHALAVLPLRPVALRIAPAPDAPPSIEVAAGTSLTFVRDSQPEGAGGNRWLEVATWDDRRGWAPAEELLEADLWIHYQRALGGAPPHTLRPAYPVRGSWAVEAPAWSTGITPISTVWLVGDSAWSARVAAIDTLADGCPGGGGHRLALLGDAAGGAGRGRGASGAAGTPDLERAVLAAPAGAAPSARALAVRSLPDVEPELARAALDAARALVAETPGDPGGGTGDPEVWYARVGEEALWAVLRWPATGAGPAGRTAALVLEPRQDRWHARRLAVVASLPSPETVAPPAGTPPATTTPAGPPLRLIGAYATGGAGPTLLLVEALEYGTSRVDLYLAGADDFRRLRAGYDWGCAAAATAAGP